MFLCIKGATEWASVSNIGVPFVLGSAGLETTCDVPCYDKGLRWCQALQELACGTGIRQQFTVEAIPMRKLLVQPSQKTPQLVSVAGEQVKGNQVWGSERPIFIQL